MLINNVGNTVLVFAVVVAVIRFIRQLCKRDYVYLVNYIRENSPRVEIGQINIVLSKKVNRLEDIRKMEQIITKKYRGNIVILNYKLLRRTRA